MPFARSKPHLLAVAFCVLVRKIKAVSSSCGILRAAYKQSYVLWLGAFCMLTESFKNS
nr:hypothetical protein [uncultured Campylobacter sp.]